MDNSIYRKNCNTGEMTKVYPITTLDNVKDLSTGESLTTILQKYNHIWLPFTGNSKTLTRQQVPPVLRKRGLWITYKSCKCNVITEWYNSDDFSNKAWGDNANWVQIVDKDTVDKIAKELIQWYKYSCKDEVSGNVNDLFHWYGSTAAFITHKSQKLIPKNSIAFLEQTGQIYVQGHLLGVSTEEFKELSSSVKKLQELLNNGDIDSIGDLTFIMNFLDGYNEGDNLRTILTKLEEKIGEPITIEELDKILV